jgi:hypothetical protein
MATAEQDATKKIESEVALNKKALGKMIKKTLIEMMDDFERMGGSPEFVEAIQDEIRNSTSNDLLDHLSSEEFEKGHFLFGKIALTFLLESEQGYKYIDILALANGNMKTWFSSVRGVPRVDTSGSSNLGIESMLNMIDPSMDLSQNSALVNLTKELTKELLQDMPKGGSPNLNFGNLMQKIQGRVEDKIQNGEFDVTELQSQAEKVMDKMSENNEFAGLLKNPELLAGMAKLSMGGGRKADKKRM